MAELKKVYFGTEETPLPVGYNKEGKYEVLAEDASAITFQTNRGDIGDIDIGERLYFDLMRNLPSRSVLPYLQDELLARDPNRSKADKRSHVSGFFGAPSIGKSFAFKTLGKMTHPKGCLLVNCKDVDMGTLFCETVFDTSAANAQKAAIDAKILTGSLKDSSIAVLKTALGEAYSEEERNGKKVIAIDWNGIKVSGQTQHDQDYQKQVIQEAIKQVCQNEGIESGGVGSIGITTRDGVAIRALDPMSSDYGRPILLDELNRAKPGTLQKLYEYFALMSDPKVDKLDVLGGGNRPFTISRDNLPPTFRVNFTGNPATEGMGSDELDAPLISRFGSEVNLFNLPDPAEQDIADRIAGNLTGVPMLQLYYANEEEFSKNPNLFQETLMAYRKGGLSEKEQAMIPEEQIYNIKDATNIRLLSEQLASFFIGVRHLTDPKSQAFQNIEVVEHDEKGGVSGSHTGLSQEYENYLKALNIDLRLANQFMDAATIERPVAQTGGKVSFAGVLGGKKRTEAPVVAVDSKQSYATRGDRLEATIESWMRRVFMPGHSGTLGISTDEMASLYKKVQELATKIGIGESKLKEGKESRSVKRIRDLYNMDAAVQNPNHHVEIVRDQMLSILKDRYGINPDNAEEALPVIQVAAALSNAKTIKETGNASVTSLFMINDDLETVQNRPIVEVLAADGDALSAIPAVEQIVHHDTFMGALAIPALSKVNMASLWNTSISTTLGLDDDETVMVAENKSPTGIGATAFITNAKGKDILSCLVADRSSGEALLISEGVDAKTADLLKKNSIVYVDKNAPNAADTAKKWIFSVAQKQPKSQEVINHVYGALGFRALSGDQPQTIENIVAAKADVAIKPIYITKVERPTADKSVDVTAHLAQKIGKGR